MLMTEEAIKIGAYLRTLRLEENDSLEEIAAGITTAATLSRFERGETQLSASSAASDVYKRQDTA